MENFLKITLRLCCFWHLSILQSKALVQTMSISQAAVALQRQGQRCCKNMPGKSQRCTLLFCITDCLGFFKNYYLLNHSPDERAESSPWWQVKKTQQLFFTVMSIWSYKSNKEHHTGPIFIRSTNRAGGKKTILSTTNPFSGLAQNYLLWRLIQPESSFLLQFHG